MCDGELKENTAAPAPKSQPSARAPEANPGPRVKMAYTSRLSTNKLRSGQISSANAWRVDGESRDTTLMRETAKSCCRRTGYNWLLLSHLRWYQPLVSVTKPARQSQKPALIPWLILLAISSAIECPFAINGLSAIWQLPVRQKMIMHCTLNLKDDRNSIAENDSS